LKKTARIHPGIGGKILWRKQAMQNSKENFSLKLIWLAVTLVGLLVTAPLALAQSGTRVSLHQVESAEGVLTIEAYAENVTDLYGLELHLKYDPAVLEVQDSQADQTGVQIEPGTLLPVNQGFVVANQANQAEGTIVYALTLLNPAPAVSGSGPMARMTFKTLQDVPSTITVEQATLVSVKLQTIPVETTALTTGSPAAETTAVTTATEASSFPWWIAAAVVLTLGILALGGLIFMGGFTKAEPKIEKGLASAAGRVELGSGSRPSAFKESALPKPPRQ
jgi:hypothetical protein